MAANALVSAGAEGLIACTCEDDYADPRVFAAVVERVYQFREGFWPEGVAHFGSIDGDFADAFGFFKNNVCVVADFVPCYWHVFLLWFLLDLIVSFSFVRRLRRREKKRSWGHPKPRQGLLPLDPAQLCWLKFPTREANACGCSRCTA